MYIFQHWHQYQRRKKPVSTIDYWQDSLQHDVFCVVFIFSVYFIACNGLLGAIKGVPDDGYAVTKNVGEQLNVTCTCSDGNPLWLFVNLNNVSQTYLVPSLSDTLPAGTEFIQEMEIIDTINYLSITIIMNLTYSTVLQCSNIGVSMPTRTRPIVLAVNIEPGGICHTVSCSLSRMNIYGIYIYIYI